MKNIQKQIKELIYTIAIMGIGLAIFKYLPMQIYGKDILFDASSHVVWTFFALYLIYFFIDQNKSWRIPYFIFSSIIIVIVAMQRIIVESHNEVGILLALAISAIAIIIPRWKEIKKKVEF